MNDDLIKKKIQEDPDFVLIPKAGNSLKKAIEMYPDGLQVSSIAKALCLTEAEVEDILEKAIQKLRDSLGEEADYD